MRHIILSLFSTALCTNTSMAKSPEGFIGLMDYAQSSHHARTSVAKYEGSYGESPVDSHRNIQPVGIGMSLNNVL